MIERHDKMGNMPSGPSRVVPYSAYFAVRRDG